MHTTLSVILLTNRETNDGENSAPAKSGRGEYLHITGIVQCVLHRVNSVCSSLYPEVRDKIRILQVTFGITLGLLS